MTHDSHRVTVAWLFCFQDEDKIKMKVEDKDCEDGKENDLEDSVFVDEEDDPDTIKPSPQFFPVSQWSVIFVVVGRFFQ